MADTTPAAPAAPFIYLGGYPGVGKQTVARELLKLIPDSRIINNHLLIDLCAAVFKQGTPEYEALRTTLRLEMLAAIVKSETIRGRTFIFTGAHVATNPVSVKARDFERAAAERGSPFVSVILTCDKEEHMARVQHPERVGKLKSTAVVSKIVESGPPFEFGSARELFLDTTGKSAEETAAAIVAHAQAASHAAQVASQAEAA